MAMEVCYYTTSGNIQPVAHFISRLPAQLQAAVLVAIERIATHGARAPGVSFRQIRGKLWEIRIHSVGAVRIFYVVLTRLGTSSSGPTMVLLHGFEKKSRKTPSREIETAEQRMKEILR
jgi:phage-related protein